MARTYPLSQIEQDAQYALRNTVGTPLDQPKRISVYNRVIDFLQGKSNWNSTKRVVQFSYLAGESDYSLSNTLGISDFKDYWELRVIDDQVGVSTEEFEDIDERKFSRWEREGRGGRYLTFEERDNEVFLRISPFTSLGKTVVHDMESLTANGTWVSDTSTSDATTLAVDTTRKKEGGASFKFNIDADQSTNNYARIYTSTVLANPLDLTDYENVGHFRVWLGLHNMSAANRALISSITLIWGSSSSAYWSVSPTTTINNGTFKADWNRIDFNWGNATKTGSPDVTSIKYFELRVNYAAGMTDTNNIRFDDLVFCQPIDCELVYFSTNMVSKAGVLQERFTTSTVDTTETLLWPTEHSNLFVDLATEMLFAQKTKNKDDYTRLVRRINEELDDAINAIGNAIVRENFSLKVHGLSSGRVDGSHLQW